METAGRINNQPTAAYSPVETKTLYSDFKNWSEKNRGGATKLWKEYNDRLLKKMDG